MDGVIGRKILERMWCCYREIEAGEKLLNDLKTLVEKNPDDPNAQKLEDNFGRRRDLQLGIPCGESGHTLVGVSPYLAKRVIKAHIANKRVELLEANNQAKIEINPPD